MNQPASLMARVITAFRTPGASFIAERSIGLTERRLIAYAFGATLFLTLGRVMAETVRPELAIGPERVPWFAATILIGFSFGLLALYAIAALIRILTRIFGGSSGWAETRLALFWSGLAAGPLIALANIVGAMVDGRSLAAMLGGAVWAILFLPMLAAANGFSVWRVALFVAVFCAILLTLPKLG